MKFVSLQKKIAFYGLIVTVIISGLLYLILKFAVVNGVNKLEDDNVSRNLQRISNGLESYFQFMIQKSGDWAKWDATYDFIDDLNEDYVQENLPEESFSTLNISMILYINDQDELVYKEGINTENGKFENIPDEVLSQLTEYVKREGGDEFLSGYLTVKDKPPLLFVAHPILKSNGEGPSKGFLIMARYLDESILQILKNSTLYPISIAEIESRDLSSNFLIAKEKIENGSTIYITREESKVYGYSLYLDISGQSSFIFRIEMPRELIKQYLNTLNFVLLTVFLAGSMLSLIVYLIIKKVVLVRLIALHEGAKNMAQGQSTAASFPINGNDEIADLAKKIRSILQNLSRAEKSMEGKNLELEKMNKFMVGREIKMAELKEEVRSLKDRLQI